MQFFRRRQRRTLDHIEFATVIGEGAVYRGNFSGGDNYLVHGQVNGICETDGHLVLSASSHWHGSINAKHVVIAGEVIGDVNASEKLELKASARIRGNIMAPVIAMAEGAVYDGEIHMRPLPQLVRFNERRSS
ncbi:MAG: polymer-forming cytoskeletal protein [Gammaproteobacteria bacterium]|nr:polymer-forming cytoskeletal protein [Gammaproteobacteria bacterium]